MLSLWDVSVIKMSRMFLSRIPLSVRRGLQDATGPFAEMISRAGRSDVLKRRRAFFYRQAPAPIKDEHKAADDNAVT